MLAKNKPNATSLLLVTPSGGGLEISVCIMGRSMVSWSMSLKSAVATRRTTSRLWRVVVRCCCDGGEDDALLLLLIPPPRVLVISIDNESMLLSSSKDTSRLGDKDVVVDVGLFCERSCKELHCGATQIERRTNNDSSTAEQLCVALFCRLNMIFVKVYLFSHSLC